MARPVLLLALCAVVAGLALVCLAFTSVAGVTFGLLGARGPTDEQLARAALLTAPAGLLLAHGLVRALAWGWAGVDAAHPPVRLAPWGLTLAAAAALAGLSLVRAPAGPAAPDGPAGAAAILDLALPALCVGAPTVVALVLVAWRALLAARPAAASSWCHLGALVALAPAAPLVLGLGGPALARLAVGVWFFVGWAGLIAGPVAIGLLLEAAVRLARARAAEGASS